MGLTCHPNAPDSLLKIVGFLLFFNSTSSCSHSPISIGRPSSYPPSTKGNPQVSDVSPLSLSTTPPEVSIGIYTPGAHNLYSSNKFPNTYETPPGYFLGNQSPNDHC